MEGETRRESGDGGGVWEGQRWVFILPPSSSSPGSFELWDPL